MPTYGYKCGECGRENDVFFRHMHPPDTQDCPHCGGRATRQIGAGGAVMFLGPGWATNHRLDHAKRFEVRSKNANAQTGVPVEEGIVRKGGG